MNIYQKIVEVRKSIEGFSKDSKSYGYTYVSGNQILRNIKTKMDELGLILIPNMDYDTFKWQKHEYVTSKGKEAMDFIVEAKMTYTWINADEPTEQIVVPWICVGQQTDDISKALGTAMTYNERYFLLKFFGLPTDCDDADNKDVEASGNVAYTKKQSNDFLISEPQGKRLFMLAKGKDSNVIKEIISKHGFASSKEITKAKYEVICKEVESL